MKPAAAANMIARLHEILSRDGPQTIFSSNGYQFTLEKFYFQGTFVKFRLCPIPLAAMALQNASCSLCFYLLADGEIPQNAHEYHKGVAGNKFGTHQLQQASCQVEKSTSHSLIMTTSDKDPSSCGQLF